MIPAEAIAELVNAGAIDPRECLFDLRVSGGRNPDGTERGYFFLHFTECRIIWRRDLAKTKAEAL